jgi:hypothetical protein
MTGCFHPVAAVLRRLLVLAALLYAFGANGPASAQSSADSWPADGDARAMRQVYFWRPDIADAIERALVDASTPEARRGAVADMTRKLEKEKKLLDSIPEEIRTADHELRTTSASSAVSWLQRLNEDPGSNRRFPKTVLDQQTFEDEIIRRANVKDHKELYDFMRKTFPADLGGRYLWNLMKLNGKDKLQFLEALHQLVDDLRDYRQQAGGLEPCKQICGGQTNAQAKAWCDAHCRDDRVR